MSHRTVRRPAVVAVSLVLALAHAAARAAVSDPAGDFLATYTGPQGGDLDVISAEVVLNPASQTLTFTGTHAAAIGTTAGALYVWGLDRGKGTQRFLNALPAIGIGVFFDSVLVLRPDGTGAFNDFITTPENSSVATLPAGSVQVTGNTISATLPVSLFGSEGLAPEDFTWNLWPRLGLGQNSQISDFAPDELRVVSTNAGVSTVPLPAALPLFGAALGGLMGFLRRSRRGG